MAKQPMKRTRVSSKPKQNYMYMTMLDLGGNEIYSRDYLLGIAKEAAEGKDLTDYNLGELRFAFMETQFYRIRNWKTAQKNILVEYLRRVPERTARASLQISFDYLHEVLQTY